MVSSLVLQPDLRAQIEEEARVAFPRECCGLIEGRRDGDTVHAVTLHAARNLATETDRFEIEPADHFTAVRAARARGHEIVGCYHSHPNGMTEISEHDRNGALDDEFVWLICAGAAENVRIAAFVRENSRFNVLNLRQTEAP